MYRGVGAADCVTRLSLSVCLSVCPWGKGRGVGQPVDIKLRLSGPVASAFTCRATSLTLFSCWCGFGFFPPLLLCFYCCFVVCFWTLFFESFYMPWYSRNIGSRIPTDTRILRCFSPVGNTKNSIFM